MEGAAPGARLRRPVALVGLMGCGKSTVGARLAALLSAPFRDADAEIEAAAGMTIPEIFRTLGEPAFRDGEKRVIARLLAGPPLVLATGGGAYMAEETRKAISAAGAAIWLRAGLETLVERTAKRKSRPLLNAGNPREILKGLMAARYPVYAGAEIAVESPQGGKAEDVAAAALAAMRAHDREAPEAARLLEEAP
ncbi:MAG: shikimate kinase [Pikeienuella sp.]|uniref:shikimate kinase n=1 Tax=Pikeienuella sp. TaxID=2831957 RepID=UPI00391CC543